MQQKDGFIHLSTSTQLRATLSRFFADTNEVVLVCIPREKLESHDAGELKFELAPSVGEEFGHIYGVSLSAAAEKAGRVLIHESRRLSRSTSSGRALCTRRTDSGRSRGWASCRSEGQGKM